MNKEYLVTVPGKVDAALQFCRFTHEVRTGEKLGFEGGTPRELSAQEARVYDAALMTLLEYFNSEGLGGGVNLDGPPDDPQQPKPQPVKP
jgi:hypothetical protein